MPLSVAFFIALLIVAVALLIEYLVRRHWLGTELSPSRLFRLVVIRYLRNFAITTLATLAGLLTILFLLEQTGIGFESPLIEKALESALELRESLEWLDKKVFLLALVVLLIALLNLLRRRIEASPGLDAGSSNSEMLTATLVTAVRKGGSWLGRAITVLFIVGLVTTTAPQFAASLDHVAVKAVAQKAEHDRKELGLASYEESARRERTRDVGKTESGNSPIESGCFSRRAGPDRDDCIEALTRAIQVTARAFERGFSAGLAQSGFDDGSGGGPNRSSPRPPKGKEAVIALEQAATRKVLLDRYAAVAPKSAHLRSVQWKAEDQPIGPITLQGDEYPLSPAPNSLERETVETAILEVSARSINQSAPISSVGVRFQHDLAAVVGSLDQKGRDAFIGSVETHQVPSPANGEVVAEANKLFVTELFKKLTDLGLGIVGLPAESIQLELSKGSINAVSEKAVDAYLPVAARLLRSFSDRWRSGVRTTTDGIWNESADLTRNVRIVPRDVRRTISNVARALPSNEMLREVVNAHPPSLVHTQLETADVVNGIKPMMESYVAARFDSDILARMTEVYDDELPNLRMANSDTNRGQLASERAWRMLESGGAARVDVARTFVKAHGHSGVGGVVIGRDPQNTRGDAPLDFVDVTWSKSAAGVRISLTARNGRVVDLGIYPAETLASGLAYAADSRVTAATILNVSALQLQRVHLHPGLVDTGIGCRLVALDRWIFDWLKQDVKIKKTYDSERDSADTLLAALRRTYRMQIRLYLASIRQLDSSRFEKIKDNFGEYMRSEGEGEFRPISTKAIVEFEEKGYPALFTAKVTARAKSEKQSQTDLVPRSTVDETLACSSKVTAESFDECVEKLVGESIKRNLTKEGIFIPIKRNDIGPAVRVIEQMLQLHEHPLPRLSDVSGVRETEYSLDHELKAMKAPELNQSAGDFDFMVLKNVNQTVFSLPPFEYSSELKRQIKGLVAGHLAEDNRAREILLDLSTFARAQRLFRLALNGYLGQDFPLARLVDLGDSVARKPDSAASLTARWVDALPDPASDRSVIFATFDRVENAHPLISKMKACRSAIEKSTAWTASPEVASTCSFEVRHDELAAACSGTEVSSRCRQGRDTLAVDAAIRLGRLRKQLLDGQPARAVCSALRLN